MGNGNTPSSSPDTSKAGGGFSGQTATPNEAREQQRKIETLEPKEVMERLTKTLNAPYLLEPQPDGKIPFEQIWDKATPEQHRDLRKWLLALETKQEQIPLALQTIPDPSTIPRKELSTHIKHFVSEFNTLTKTQSSFAAFFNSLLTKKTAGSASDAFKNVPIRGQTVNRLQSMRNLDRMQIPTALDNLETLASSEPPEKRSENKNPLFRKGKPHFRNIDRAIDYCNDIERGRLVVEEHVDAPLARERVTTLRFALENLKRSDPLGNIQYTQRKNQKPSILQKPLMLAGFGGASVFALMAAIPALWRLIKEKKSPSQAEILTGGGYLAVAALIARGPGAPKGTKAMVRDQMEVLRSDALSSGVRKMGVTHMLNATSDLHGLLANKSAAVRRIVRSDSLGVSIASLTKLLEPTSPLLLALSQEGEQALDDRERKAFLRFSYEKLRRRKPDSLERLQALLQTKELIETK